MNKKEAVLAEVLLAINLSAINLTSAADPGHGAAYIGSGTFESGNYIFSANLDILKNFSVGGNNFFVNNNMGFVGIGTVEVQDEDK